MNPKASKTADVVSYTQKYPVSKRSYEHYRDNLDRLFHVHYDSRYHSITIFKYADIRMEFV